ncbi:MAG: site-specific DNA-methyltransferase [Verrucomicrobia bacterium]|nr:site-specific DNA-methyltransferase [Verrucomicrobiota bacterium]
MLRLLEARDQRDATRFGLVWEANEIERDKALNNDFVTLDLVDSLSVGDAPWRNLVIEADNYDALRYLRMTFTGQVKCILIDPPYNTGNNDFIYNDHFVSKDDSWRHSTWLEFMYRRLTLARDLLSQDGVLFIHIGEEEMTRLGCLMDKVMPGRKVGTFVWRTRSGSNDSKHYFTSLDHEYILCYANPVFSFAGSTKGLKDYDNPDNDLRGPWVSGDLTKAHSMRERANGYYPIQNPESGIWYPCNPERVWAFASESRVALGQKLRSKPMEQLIRDEKILWPEEPEPAFYQSLQELKQAINEGAAPKNLRLELPDLSFWVGKRIGRNMPRYKKHKTELKRLEKPISTWIVPAATKKADLEELFTEQPETTFLATGYTSDGTSLLREMLGNSDFPFPKPLELIQSLIAQATTGNDIVLDFFGGSGTTAHAVLALNAEDDSDRRFILVSTTEATAEEPDKNVCRDITQKRLSKAINGYSYPTKKGLKEIPGLGGDFAYLRTHRIAAGRLLEVEHAQVWIALQLAHLDSFTAYEEKSFLWAGDEESAVCYVPRFSRDLAAALRRKVKESASVALYSWQPHTLRQHVRDSHVTHLSVSDTLTRRFGLNLTLSPA